MATEHRRFRLIDADVDRSVGRVVVMVAKARGVSLADIAEHLKMHPNGLSDRIAGRRQFRVAELVAIGAYLGVDPGVFLRDPDELIERLDPSGPRRPPSDTSNVTDLAAKRSGKRPRGTTSPSIPWYYGTDGVTAA